MSLGPDGVTSNDDIHLSSFWLWSSPSWRHDLIRRPRLVSCAAAVYLALAWRLLRLRRALRLRGDVLLSALVVAPFAPVAWLVATTELAAGLELLQHVVVPGPVAIAASLWVVALLAAFGVRLGTRAATMPA